MRSCKLFLGVGSVLFASYCAYLALNESITERAYSGTGSVFTFGLLLAALLLCAGIVAIAGRATRRGTLASGAMYLCAFVLGVLFHGTHGWMLTAGFTALALAAAFLCHGVWMDAPEKSV